MHEARSENPGPADAGGTLRAQLADLTTESVDESLRDLDRLPTGDLVQAMNAQDALVHSAVGRLGPVIADTVDAITARMRTGGRLIYIGAGSSGRLGVLDASECPPTFGTDPALVVGLIAGGDSALRTAVEGAEDDPSGGVQSLTDVALTAADTVVGISASGRAPFVIGALEYAKEVGALTVAVACNEHSSIGALADFAIEVVVGPEFVAGSTRLKSGTAQKLVLNMLSTLTMIRLGKTYGNIMVDLKASNKKLQARAVRTIMSIAGVDASTAANALDAAHGSTKEALMSVMTGLPADQAHEVLLRYGGHLRAALESTQRQQ
ncbi:MAG: N-acetylmuramic acid 6-phosphate etherase [Microbacteriaceae bacterium]